METNEREILFVCQDTSIDTQLLQGPTGAFFQVGDEDGCWEGRPWMWVVVGEEEI